MVEQQPGIFREVNNNRDAIEECKPLGWPMPWRCPWALTNIQRFFVIAVVTSL
jgi:hypothetical protein